jgi:GNAT superfamily N-acetyltransferase
LHTSERAEHLPAVEAARSEDAAGIAQVHGRTWHVAYAHVFPADGLERLTAAEAQARRAQFWRETIERGDDRSHTLVRRDADVVAGFASLGPAREDDSVGELYAIYVLPEMWGLGIGQALMAEALDRLRSDGFAEAILWVLEDNPRTRSFYERSGWSADGGVKDEEWMGTLAREIRYRIALEPAS